eukprot:TRINITY_DN4391_c0_g1_i2.p1 TRINITY_DN4391_c0_g1~~TRINITY_DN4391_c0_g1_i2.p1  ORF type:complete len:215 (+),score=42.04 TRINITY_DN4391_c0_g1_i2:202-846(+)
MRVIEDASHLGFSTLVEASNAEVSPAAVRPALMLTMIRETLAEASNKGMLADGVMPLVDARVDDLSTAFSSLLRIAGTPMPFIYAHFLKVIMTIYVIAIPFGLAQNLHWVTPVLCFLIAALFFGVEAIAIELEEPLGDDLNDVDPSFHLIRMDIETAAIVTHKCKQFSLKTLEGPRLASLWRNLDLHAPGTGSHRNSRVTSLSQSQDGQHLLPT